MSAYQDKIVDYENYIKYVEPLLKRFGGVSFFHFVTMILDSGAKNCQEMNQCSLNNHWKPFISRCAYCDVSYSIIARAETIREDQRYIGHMANVTFYELGKIRKKSIIHVCIILYSLFRNQQESWREHKRKGQEIFFRVRY